MYADICKTALQANGIEITPDIEYQIISYCRKRQAEYNRQVASEGIREVQNIMLTQSSLSWHCNNANN